MAQDAYWTGLNWTAMGAFAAGIGTLASPFLKAWWDGRVARSTSQIKAAETTQDRLDRIGREQFENEKAESDRLRTRLRDEEERRAEIEADRDNGWDRGRGMEDVAHDHKHIADNLVQRFNALLTMFGDLASGRMGAERALALLPEIKRAESPPSVPDLRVVTRKKPIASPPEPEP